MNLMKNRTGIPTGRRILGDSQSVPRILILKNLNTNLTKSHLRFNMNKESMTRARASNRIHPTNNNKNTMEEEEEKDIRKDLNLALGGSLILGKGPRSRSR